MASIETFRLRSTLDVIGNGNMVMDVDQLDARSSHIGEFVRNGLLDDDETQEETLKENLQDSSASRLLDTTAFSAVCVDQGGFRTTGLLTDADDTQESFDHSGSPSTVAERSRVAREEDTMDVRMSGVESGFAPAGLLDALCAEQDFSEVTKLRSDALESQTQTGAEQTLVNSQEELPSLSQILHPNGRAPSFKGRRTVSSSSYSPTSSVSATTYDGTTVVFKKRMKTKSHSVNGRQQLGKLLDTPVHKLKDQLSEIMVARLTRPEAGCSTPTVFKPIDNDLWVDRYRPTRFIDLLGDERVHRDTLAWLKEWDHCVFGRRKALHKSKKTSDDQATNSEDKYEDAYHRPHEKLLLLSGPAGFGKTTLAHVVARQAGYDVMEINASDSRSGQVIDDRIRPTLESGSAVGSKKPVCVIIDEIDGATGAGDNASTFIYKLISLTFDGAKKKGRRDKNKDSRRPLLRPVICICNDLYAASLTKLRQHARIVRFSRPADIYLTKRLRSICDCEGLRAESRALTTLVGIAKGDMRGCLNTLQFIKARQQEVTETIIRAATVGMKEGDSSFTSVMRNLFSPLARKRMKELGMSEFEESRYVSRLSADIDASGSVDKVAIACFEHYLNLRHYEASLSRHEKAVNCLVAFDSLSGAMRSEREYGLIPYLSYSLVPFYPLFNERGGGKVERPKADWDTLTRTRTNEELYKSLAKCVQSATGQCHVGLRHFLSNEIMQLELVPYLNRIISPPMRPINSQVTKPHERAVLARLVDIMVSLDLRFVQDKTEDGQLVYRLEPPIDAFITYDGKRSPDVAVQRYATRHVIAGEIDAQLIVRHAEVTERGKTRNLDMFKRARKGEKGGAGEILNADLSALGKRKATEAVDIADKPPVDFFGRPIITSTAPASKKSKGAAAEPMPGPAAMMTERKCKVSFRFNEGNSAAVRKPVKVCSLL